MFKRIRYQFGCVERKTRKKGPDVWALRYREQLPGRTAVHKSTIVGTVEQYPTESHARRAAQTLLLSINAENPNAGVVPFGALIDRNLAEELPDRHSTSRGYQCWLKNHIRPKWGEYPIDQIKPLAVEQWLKGLDLAPKSKGHLKNQMRILFNCAMRWDLVPYQANPMGLVWVKDSSKRVRVPAVLTIEQFKKFFCKSRSPTARCALWQGAWGCGSARFSDCNGATSIGRNTRCKSDGLGSMLMLASPKPRIQRGQCPLIPPWGNFCGIIGIGFLLRFKRAYGFSRANAPACPRTLGVRNVAGCSVQEKRSVWEDSAGMHFGTPIQPCSTSTGQT